VLAEAFVAAAAISPYFAVDLIPAGPGWRPFQELLDPAVLGDSVTSLQRILAERTRVPVTDLDLRSCASTHFLALASRLVAPGLGSAALRGVVPVLTPSAIGWQRVDGGPIPIAVHAVEAAGADGPGHAAELMLTSLVQPVIAPLAGAFAETFRLSDQVLWGNVASALAGAAGMLTRSGVMLALDPVSIAVALGDLGPLVGMGSWRQPDAAPAGRFFVRNNCCLFYRIPGGGMCGDCVLITDR
jgi:hypothetical protein